MPLYYCIWIFLPEHRKQTRECFELIWCEVVLGLGEVVLGDPAHQASYPLLGIVRQIALRDEGLAIAEALWQARLDARDRALVPLDDARRATAGTPEERVRTFVDRALAGDRPLLRSFWLRAAAEIITEARSDVRKTLYDLAARRVSTTFRIDPRERQAAVRHLAAQVLPVA